MKLKTFKPAVILMAICLAAAPCFAQTSAAPGGAVTTAPVAPVAPAVDVTVPVITAVAAPAPTAVTVTGYQAVKLKLRDLKTQIKTVALRANAQVRFDTKTIMIADVKVPVPQIAVGYKDGDDAEVVSSTSDDRGSDQVSQVKNYSKVYPADGGDQLVIDNRYGDIVVNTWDKPQFKVDVQIKVDAASDGDAQKALDNVSIADSKDGSSVAFRTDIGSASGSWLSWLTGDHQGHKLKILYTVYMPAKNELVIRNSYGAIQLPDLDGKTTIACSYGSLTAKSLKNESTIRASYSNVDLGSLDATWIDISYGSLNIGTVNRIASNASYTAVKIGKIRETGAFNLRYAGSFSIGEIYKSLNDLAINASYSNVDIGLSGDENVNFAVSLRYGDFGYGNRTITFTDKTPDDGKPHNTKSYKGSLGNGNPDKNIRINSSYGNVNFN